METLQEVHVLVISKGDDRASAAIKGKTLKTVLPVETNLRRKSLTSSTLVFKTLPSQATLDKASEECKRRISDMGFFDLEEDCLIDIHPGGVTGIYTAFMAAWFANNEVEFSFLLSTSRWYETMASGTLDVISPTIDEMLSIDNAPAVVTSPLDIVREKLSNARRTFAVYKAVSGDTIVEYGYPSICSACTNFHTKDANGAYEFIAHLLQGFKSKEEDKWTIPFSVGGVDMVNNIVAMLEEHQSFEKLS